MRGIMTTALLGAVLMATAVASPAIASESDRKGATLKESRMASKAERFWTWFARESGRFSVASGYSEAMFDEITAEVQRYSKGVHVMLGGGSNGERELVLTTEGNPDYIDAVRDLVRAAPEIPGWTVTAFKPPQGFEFAIRIIERDIDATTLRFRRAPDLDSEDGLGIEVFFPDYDPKQEEAFTFAAYIILDMGLGELSTMMDIGVVAVGGLDSATTAVASTRPPSELPDVIAAWRAKRVN
jgi:hypothetical protein